MTRNQTIGRRRTTRFLSWCGLVAALVIPGSTRPAAAQSSVSLERFEVQLWPDYDKPSALIMYRARLAASTSLPAELSFRIPAAVGEPHAVAYRADGDRLLMAEHSREVDDEWATIRIKAPSREVQLEYYAPILSHDGKRMFSYTWPGDMSVEHFVYGAQQPAAASEFELSPPATEELPRGDGLVVHTADLGAVAAGQTVEVRISYVSDGTLSARPAAPKPAKSPAARRKARPNRAAPASPAPPAAARAGEGHDWLIWLILALTVGAGAVWVVFAGRNRG